MNILIVYDIVHINSLRYSPYCIPRCVFLIGIPALFNNQCKSISILSTQAKVVSSVPALYLPPISSVPALSYSTNTTPVDYTLLPINQSTIFYKLVNSLKSKGFSPLYFVVSPTRTKIDSLLANHSGMGGYYCWFCISNNSDYMGSSIN
jgi:hypothetical protein